VRETYEKEGTTETAEIAEASLLCGPLRTTRTTEPDENDFSV
jgi:hypothetical protein